MAAVPRRWRLGVPVVVVWLTLSAFMPALLADFVHWDDNDLLFGVTQYRTLTAESLRWMWSTSFAGHFQPLTWLSYSLDFSWSNNDPFGYHLTNVVLHLANTVIFFLIALRLFRTRARSEAQSRSRVMYMAAGMAAVLFSIHPLRVESVAWIAERRDVLSGFFYLLSVLWYVHFASVRADDAKTETKNGGRGFYVASLVCFALSLLAKASGVMLPLVFLVLDAYPLGRMTSPKGFRLRLLLRAIAEKLPFFALAVIVGIRAVYAQDEGGALYALADHDAASRVAQSVYGVAFYIWKSLWPSGLGPLYPIPSREALFGTMLWVSSGMVLGTFGVALAVRRRYPIVLAVLVAYVVQLLPTVGVFQSGPQFVADRYSYLACLGFALLGGASVLAWAWRRGRQTFGSERALVALGMALVLAGLSHQTFRQCGYWDTPLTLWRRGIEVSPGSSIAHVNYADALAESGEVRYALMSYDRALRLDPRDPIAASHFGRVLARVGDFENAAKMFTLAVRLDPERSADYLRLANAMVDSGRPDFAVRVLTDRARHAPYDLDIVGMLAELRATYPDESIRNGAEAVRWATHINRAQGGQNPSTMLILSTALAEAGEFDRAVKVTTKAITFALQAKNPRLVSELRRRLVMFREQRPYHFGE